MILNSCLCPPYLRPGDTIGLAATARKIGEKELAPSIELLESKGFAVKTASNIFSEHHQYAGTDNERLSGFQELLDDTEVKAIICVRGGYGTLRIIDRIRWQSMLENPKWIAGYSDITVFHSHLQKVLNIQSLHCIMPLNIKQATDDSAEVVSMLDALTGRPLHYTFPTHSLNRPGNCTGIITGGNLSILYALNASVSDIDTKNKILFLEDLDEYLYHIDRMMMSLRRSGKLEHLAGLLVGDMSEMNDNEIPFGKQAYEIIADAVSEYSYPCCFGFPAGHAGRNLALYLGRKANMVSSPQGCSLLYS